MANRYTNLSTSTYRELSPQEIMMVPLSKQKQHDEAQAMTDQYTALSANRLTQDAELVDARLGQLRGEADSISSELLDRGFNRDLLGRLNKLKRDKELEYGQQGLIGNAQENYKKAMSFVDDLATKKERQAGWSPAQAKSWAQKQVMDFQGTKSDDGSFRSFSGKELDANVDENKWIVDNLKIIAADTSPIALQHAGSLDQFNRAYRSGKIEQQTYEKIMNSLVGVAQYDPALQRSLNQKGLLTGEKNANNVGEWIIDPKTKKRVFRPGSTFGSMLSHAAMGAQYKKTDYNYSIIKDDLALHMAKKGLDQQDADNLAVAVNGELTAVDPVKYDDLKKSLDLGFQEMSQSKLRISSMYNELKGRGLNDTQIKNDPAYKQMVQNHNDSSVRYNNTKNSLDKVMNVVDSQLNPKDKELYKTANAVKSIFDKAEEFRKTGGNNSNYLQKAMADNGISMEEFNKTRRGKIGISTESLLMEIMYKKATGKNKLFERHEYKESLEMASKMQKKADIYLKNNPLSQDYVNFSGQVTGEYKGKIGALEQKLSTLFTTTGGRGWSHAFSGGNISDIMADYSDDKYKFNILTSNGISPTGDAIETLTVTDDKGVVVKAFPVTRGRHSNITQYEVGKALSAHPVYSKEGKEMTNNYELMPKVQELKIHEDSFTSKVVPGLETEDGSLVLIKKYPSGAFTVTPVNKEKALKGEYIPTSTESQSLGGQQDIVNYLNQ